MRTIYALFIELLTKDTTRTFTQFDSALQIDPAYLLALTSQATIAQQYGNYGRAMILVQKARTAHPESPTPYMLAGELYTAQGQYAKAIEDYQALLKRFPDYDRALRALYQSFLQTRAFDSARVFLERLRASHSDDNYILTSYYNGLANLAGWQGKFKTAIGYRHKALRAVMITGDSNLVANAYGELSYIFSLLEQNDSSLFYSQLGFEWATPFQKVEYPITLAALRPDLADSARPLFNRGVDQFKPRIPAQLWPIADGLTMLFEGSLSHDTAMLIRGDSLIYAANPGDEKSILREQAVLFVLTGQFQKGLDLLEQFITGAEVSTSGYRHPMTLYYYARAHEGLGNLKMAVDGSREMISYWGKPEIEIKEIKDARERLSHLAS
jgi:tetratricopeptide (TPR) repeat protein